MHRQSPVVHYWTISEITCNKNCCLCQFSNDSDYLFSISITDITELLPLYWKVHFLPAVFNLKHFSSYLIWTFFIFLVKPCRAKADALKRTLTHLKILTHFSRKSNALTNYAFQKSQSSPEYVYCLDSGESGEENRAGCYVKCGFPNTARVVNRIDISTRAAAQIATAVLEDIGDNTVITRKKIRCELARVLINSRKKIQQEEIICKILLYWTFLWQCFFTIICKILLY